MQAKKTESKISSALSKTSSFFGNVPTKIRNMSTGKKVYSGLWLVLALYLIALIVIMVVQNNDISDNKAAISAYQSLNDKLLIPVLPTGNTIDVATLVSLSNGNATMQGALGSAKASSAQLAALTEMINAANKMTYSTIGSANYVDANAALKAAIDAVGSASAATKAASLTALSTLFSTTLKLSTENVTALNAYFNSLSSAEVSAISALSVAGASQLATNYTNLSAFFTKFNTDASYAALAEVMRTANTSGSLGKVANLFSKLGSGNAVTQSLTVNEIASTFGTLKVSAASVTQLNGLLGTLTGQQAAGLSYFVTSTGNNVGAVDLMANIVKTHNPIIIPTLINEVTNFQAPYTVTIKDDNTSIAANTAVFVALLVVTVFTTAIVSYNEQKIKKSAKVNAKEVRK